MPSKLPQPKIIAETSEFVVVEKPAGLLVHEAASSPDEKTFVDWLLKKFPDVSGVGDEPELRPGIVHRLDREASGLMVIARTQKMFNVLKEQFQARTIEKEYLVLVHGKLINEFGEIVLPIGRAAHGGRMAAHSIGTEDAHEARTEYHVKQRYTTATLARVKIHTGRTHQIRVHMYALQHPVVGDTLYAVKKVGKSFPSLDRLFLHSAKLAFVDGSGKPVVFESALPPELDEFLSKLTKA